MSRGVIVGVAFLVLALAGAQLIRPNFRNPNIRPELTIEARLGAASPAAGALERSCGDCHSYATEWPGYARFAPLSWLMASAVGRGRKAVNYSEWATYPPDRQRALLEQSCADVTARKMPPGVWTALKPKSRLSGSDAEAICAAAHQS